MNVIAPKVGFDNLNWHATTIYMRRRTLRSFFETQEAYTRTHNSLTALAEKLLGFKVLLHMPCCLNSGSPSMEPASSSTSFSQEVGGGAGSSMATAHIQP